MNSNLSIRSNIKETDDKYVAAVHEAAHGIATYSLGALARNSLQSSIVVVGTHRIRVTHAGPVPALAGEPAALRAPVVASIVNRVMVSEPRLAT